jgi:hypothetical protein
MLILLLLRRVVLLRGGSPRLSWLLLRLGESGESILVKGTVVSHDECRCLGWRWFLWEKL